MIGKAAAADPLVPVRPRLRKPRFGVIIGRRRRAVAPSEGAERLLAGAQAGLGARPAALEPEPQIGAQPQRRLNPLRLADGVAVTVAYVPPASIAAAVVERRLAVELEIDEAVEAAEGAQQDVLGDAVARCADVPMRARPRPARSRSGARRAPRASRSACPMSFPGSWCPAGSGGRQGPFGPAGPRETAPPAGRGSPRRRSARPSVAATATRRSRSARRARRLHSPRAARNRQSAETSFRLGESHGPGRRRSAAPAPRGDCTSSPRAGFWTRRAALTSRDAYVTPETGPEPPARSGLESKSTRVGQRMLPVQ